MLIERPLRAVAGVCGEFDIFDDILRPVSGRLFFTFNGVPDCMYPSKEEGLMSVDESLINGEDPNDCGEPSPFVYELGCTCRKCAPGCANGEKGALSGVCEYPPVKLMPLETAGWSLFPE